MLVHALTASPNSPALTSSGLETPSSELSIQMASSASADIAHGVFSHVAVVAGEPTVVNVNVVLLVTVTV